MIRSPIRSGFRYTFAMLKPDVANTLVIREGILSSIEGNGFKIVEIKKTRMTSQLAEEFYSEHHGKFFFNRLITFMSSSPIYAMILMKENAISSWRSVIGKANVYRTIYSDPDCLRSRFGLTDTRNAVHGSDSEETVRREASFFFPHFFTHNSDNNKISDGDNNSSEDDRDNQIQSDDKPPR